jgi:hypothetical protein
MHPAAAGISTASRLRSGVYGSWFSPSQKRRCLRCFWAVFYCTASEPSAMGADAASLLLFGRAASYGVCAAVGVRGLAAGPWFSMLTLGTPRPRGLRGTTAGIVFRAPVSPAKNGNLKGCRAQ